MFKCYVSGQFKYNDKNDKAVSQNSASSANFKRKNQIFNSDTSFFLTNEVKWHPEQLGPTTPLQMNYVKASELFAKGSLQFIDSKGKNLLEPPKYEDWDATLSKGKVKIRIIKTDGSVAYADVYIPSEIRVEKDIDSGTNLLAQIITSQPTIPFVQLTLATIKNKGVLNLISNNLKNGKEFAIDWYPGQVKKSSLFIADNGIINLSEKNSTRVTFAYTESVNNPSNNQVAKKQFGPTKKLLGEVIRFQGKDYLIDSLKGLEKYNMALIAEVKNNTLTTTDYEEWFHKAFKKSDEQFSYIYDPSKIKYPGFFITPEMQEDIGIRTLFEATNTGVINLKSSIEAVGQLWARAYNVWAHDQGEVNNQSTIKVRSSNTQNTLIEKGGKYNNFGLIEFDVTGTNWADQVIGNNSIYINHRDGVIAISDSQKNDTSTNSPHPNKYHKLDRNIATEVLDGASSVNQGKYLIGFKRTSGLVGTATGVHINNAGAFTNDGVMSIGKDAKGSDIALQGGSSAETLSIDNAYNAVSAYFNSKGNPININNNGEIIISAGSINSVGVNIGEDPAIKDDIKKDNMPKNINVVNQGKIKVEGANSSGIRAAGRLTGSNKNNIINTGIIDVTGAGSSGLFSTLGSEITNDGKIIVTGKNNINNRVYGIKADNATINLTKNSEVTVKGSYATGLFARAGGIINVQGGKVDTPSMPNTNDQVIFWVSGKNAEGGTSKIRFLSPTNYMLTNNNSTLFRVDQGASYDGSGSNLKSLDINGAGSTGYIIANKGTEFKSGDTVINVNGDEASGINVNSGAGNDNKVKLSKETKISVTGIGSTIATVDGNTYNIMGKLIGQDGARLITEARLTAGVKGQIAENAIGYKVINSGELVHNGEINFDKASNMTGVFINGGTLTNNGYISSNGIGVDVHQSNKARSIVNNSGIISASDGKSAIRINDNASLTVEGRGAIIGKGSADAIRVMPGASLKTNSANIFVNGSGSGIHFLNAPGVVSGGTFTLSGTGNITVSGNNASGIKVEGEIGKDTVRSDLNIDTTGAEHLIINVQDRGGFGITTNTSGYVYSGASVNINSNFGQSALLVKGTTSDIKQAGNLISNSNSSSVVDLTQLSKNISLIRFSNSGKIISHGKSTAINASNRNNPTYIENSKKGIISGGVIVGDGHNEILLKDESNTSDIELGNGNNLITIKDSAKLTRAIKLGNGKNKVVLKDNSKTNSVIMGDGGNIVNIHSNTKNGSLVSGDGNDIFTLLGVNVDNKNKSQSENVFKLIDGGQGLNHLNIRDKSWFILNSQFRIKNINNIAVENNSTFEEKNERLSLTRNGITSGIIDVDSNSTYFVNHDLTTTDYNLDLKIRGKGTIRTDTNGKKFSIHNYEFLKNNFSGVLDIGNGYISIDGGNTEALKKSTLKLSKNGNGILNKVDGPQKIGGLDFNDGKLSFEANFIGNKENELKSHLLVDDLNIRGSGIVQVKLGGFDNDYFGHHQLKELTKKNLLSQDDGNTLVALVKSSGRVIGEATNIKILMANGDENLLNTFGDKQEDIRQDTKKVATGLYGIGATTGKQGDGLYISYFLKKVNVIKDKILNLQSSPGDKLNSLKFSAKITGEGGIIINGYGDSVSLANSGNDYTGSTIVNNGKLLLSENHVLGQKDRHTSELNLRSNVVINFNDTIQNIGKIISNTESTVALQQGSLYIHNGGQIKGKITSSPLATLNLHGGVTSLTSANTEYHGNTFIKKSASVNMNNVAGLGDGEISILGSLSIIGSKPGLLVNKLNGSGVFNAVNGSDVEIANDNSNFKGEFYVDHASSLRLSSPNHIGDASNSNKIGGTIPEGASNTRSLPLINNEGNIWIKSHIGIDWIVKNSITGTGDLHKSGDGNLTLTQSSANYSGQTWVENGSLTAGTEYSKVHMQTSMVNISPNASFGGSGGISGSVKNKGRFFIGGIDKANDTQPSSYKVNMNFANEGAVIVGGNSVTGNRLYIGGNYISQGGAIYLNSKLNKGHIETDTDNIQVDGNVINQSGPTQIFVKNIGGKGDFTQPEAIKLISVKGHSDENAFSLGSPVVIGAYEYLLGKGSHDNNWYISSFNPVFPPSENLGESTSHYVNPMIGGFISNGNGLSMFNMSLHDRLGETQYTNSMASDEDLERSIWLRISHDDNQYNVANGQLKINSKNSIVQLGHDVIKWSGGDNWHTRIGVIGGTGNQKATSQSYRTNTKSFSKINSAYSVGIYGTIYQQSIEGKGSYLDAWGLYNWYKNSVGMSGYSDAKYSSHGSVLSLEAGHTFTFSNSDQTKNSWNLLPMAQFTFGHMSSNSAKNDSGLTVSKSSVKNIESRLGSRLSYSYHTDGNGIIKPFAELNWRHDLKSGEFNFNDQKKFSGDKSKNRYEFKLGLEAANIKGLDGWINLSHSVGENSYREAKAIVGVKYNW
ncbi:autotransporter outer membrane beta-barrel domain-containing protein [Serratia sarumanii]|uniref:autotransporter outer membrane beta-barrel domain-containing protein n=1 Tax=Serratia sarumanii TaxID=3020826 RepID=UPI003F81B658